MHELGARDLRTDMGSIPTATTSATTLGPTARHTTLPMLVHAFNPPPARRAPLRVLAMTTTTRAGGLAQWWQWSVCPMCQGLGVKGL